MHTPVPYPMEQQNYRSDIALDGEIRSQLQNTKDSWPTHPHSTTMQGLSLDLFTVIPATVLSADGVTLQNRQHAPNDQGQRTNSNNNNYNNNNSSSSQSRHTRSRSRHEQGQSRSQRNDHNNDRENPGYRHHHHRHHSHNRHCNQQDLSHQMRLLMISPSNNSSQTTGDSSEAISAMDIVGDTSTTPTAMFPNDKTNIATAMGKINRHHNNWHLKNDSGHAPSAGRSQKNPGRRRSRIDRSWTKEPLPALSLSLPISGQAHMQPHRFHRPQQHLHQRWDRQFQDHNTDSHGPHSNSGRHGQRSGDVAVDRRGAKYGRGGERGPTANVPQLMYAGESKKSCPSRSINERVNAFDANGSATGAGSKPTKGEIKDTKDRAYGKGMSRGGNHGTRGGSGSSKKSNGYVNGITNKGPCPPSSAFEGYRQQYSTTNGIDSRFHMDSEGPRPVSLSASSSPSLAQNPTLSSPTLLRLSPTAPGALPPQRSMLSMMISEITRALWTDASQVTRLVLPESLLLFASGMGMEMNVQEQISTFDQARLLMIVRKIPRLIHFTAHIRIISHAPGLLETLLEYHYPHLNSFQLVDYALDDDSTKQKMAALKAQMLDGGRPRDLYPQGIQQRPDLTQSLAWELQHQHQHQYQQQKFHAEQQFHPQYSSDNNNSLFIPAVSMTLGQKQHVQQSYTPESWTHHYQQPPQPKFHPYHGQQGPQPMMARHPPQGLYSGQSSPVAQSQLQLQRSQLKESQQQQQLEEDTLRRLCRNCLRLLEFCPNLKLFESKVPLPLEDLIGSIPRWSSASSLTMLRIEIQEFTGSGAVDMEEEMVMQMFVKSLFMGNGKNGSPGSDGGSSAGGDSGSFSGSTSSSSGGGGDSSPPTGAMAALVLNQRIPAFANGSPTFLPSSDSTASTSTSESSKSGRLGPSGRASLGSMSGSRSSSSGAGSISSSFNGFNDASSSSSFLLDSSGSSSSSSKWPTSSSTSGNRRSSGGGGTNDTGSWTNPLSSSWSSSASTTLSTSPTPPVPMTPMPPNGSGYSIAVPALALLPAILEAKESFQESPLSSRKSVQEGFFGSNFYTLEGLPSPIPPSTPTEISVSPVPSTMFTSMANLSSAGTGGSGGGCDPSSRSNSGYCPIDSVGRLVALQFLVEHQLVYLPNLDRFFLGNRVFKIPSRRNSSK